MELLFNDSATFLLLLHFVLFGNRKQDFETLFGDPGCLSKFERFAYKYEILVHQKSNGRQSVLFAIICFFVCLGMLHGSNGIKLWYRPGKNIYEFQQEMFSEKSIIFRYQPTSQTETCLRLLQMSRNYFPEQFSI